MKKKARIFNVVIEKDEDGFLIAEVPELKGCHTQARSLDVLMARTREAIKLCLEEEQSSLDQELEFVGIQRIAV